MLSRIFKILAFLSFTYSPSQLRADEVDCLGSKVKAGSFGQVYNLSYNSTLARSDNAYSNRYMDFDALNSYATSRSGQASIYFKGQKLLDDEEQRYAAMELNLSYRENFCLNEKITLSLTGMYGAPVNRELVKYDHSRGQAVVKANLTRKEVDGEGLIVSLLSTSRKHFYRYTDNSGGKILKEYSFEEGIYLAYAKDNLELGVMFIDFMGWDFNGEQLDSQYYHEESISYAINKFWSASLAHRSDGTLANYAGTGYDIHLHDRDRSELALTLTYTD